MKGQGLLPNAWGANSSKPKERRYADEDPVEEPQTPPPVEIVDSSRIDRPVTAAEPPMIASDDVVVDGLGDAGSATAVDDVAVVRGGPGRKVKPVSDRKTERVISPKVRQGITPRVGSLGKPLTVYFSAYIPRDTYTRFRALATEREMRTIELLMRVCRAEGPALREERQATAGRVFRRAKQEAPSPRNLGVLPSELEELDDLGEACSWSRSELVTELMRRA